MRFDTAQAAKAIGVPEEAVIQWEVSGAISHAVLEKMAKATRTPIGYLFLSTPPEIKIPLADFRTLGSRPAGPPSPEMLEAIFSCQRRQDWFRAHQLENGADRLAWVGSCPHGTDHKVTAKRIREALGFHPSESGEVSLDGVIRECINATEAIGVLVVKNGVIGNSNKRKLDTAEFRGFALSDELAPLLFINGGDFKAAQIFTWIHELAHLFAGVSAVNNSENTLPNTASPVESYCNAVAAEYLVPAKELSALAGRSTSASPEELVTKARLHFRVSDLVIVRRLFDIGELSQELFEQWYKEKLTAHQRGAKASGGDFYKNQKYRIGPRFASAVISSTLNGRTLYRDALSLLGLKGKSFDTYAQQLGFQV